MNRLLKSLFRWRAPSVSGGEDPLGAFLQGSGQSVVAPEVLLRIL